MTIADIQDYIQSVYNENDLGGTEILDEIEDMLEQLSEERDGNWIVVEDCCNRGIYCSNCKKKIFDFTHKPKKKQSRYCSNCGAQMDMN